MLNRSWATTLDGSCGVRSPDTYELGTIDGSYSTAEMAWIQFPGSRVVFGGVSAPVLRAPLHALVASAACPLRRCLIILGKCLCHKFHYS